MTLLLDESVPHALKTGLRGHTVKTVQEMGWAGVTNGELLRKAEDSFDTLITADKKLRYQQNLTGRKISVVVLPTNRVPDVLRLVAAIEDALRTIRPGSVVEIPAQPG